MTIRNDATRQTLRLADKRRPRAVVPRQGQVLLDADFDQQSAHLLGRIDSADADMLGQSPGLPMAGRFAYPAGSQAFLITVALTPNLCGIGAGQGYLGGRQVENPIACTLATQPHPRTETVPVKPYVIGLKTLIRHIDPVEDPVLADKALGDAQAAGRSLVDWQVFPFAPTALVGPLTCAAAATSADWLKLIAPSSGTLSVLPDAAPAATDPCSLTPSGGFTRLENLLYRVEVHGGIARADFPNADGPRFGLNGLKVKLSRRNASVMARVQSVSGTEVTVSPTMLDPLNWFAAGLYAEIVSPHNDVDPRDALTSERFFRIARATDSLVVLDDAAKPRLAALSGQPNWFLRLWDAFPDGTGLVTVVVAGVVSQQIDLGDGLKAQLGAGASPATTTFRRGDFWTFAARADGSIDWPAAFAARADGSIDWPAGAPFEVPHGPLTQYAPLQVLNVPNANPGDEDCRIPLAALTDRALFYRGGDGQAVPVPATGSFAALPAKLRVAVMRGRTPVLGAQVVWRVPAGSANSQIDGVLISSVATQTDATGLVEVTWAIDSSQPLSAHKIEAVLFANGVPEPQPVVFTAGFRTARLTSYQPGPCALLSTTTNVQEALDKLCENIGNPPEPTLQLTAITLMGPPGNTELIKDKVILNGATVPSDAFERAITIGINGGPLESKFQPFDPIVEVELDIPYPTTRDEKAFWANESRPANKPPEIISTFGTQRIRLEAKIEVTSSQAGSELIWIPSPGTQNFLHSAPFHLFSQLDPDISGWQTDFQSLILCRLRIRSAHVWMTDKDDNNKRIYLNAEHLGISAGATDRELLVDDRDPQRAADLDMFFYLEVQRR